MSELRVNAVTDETGGNTATINSMTPTADSLQGFRNRLINGNMVLDQRNAGASVTPANDAYTLDRWKASADAASKFSVQQVSDAPTGFAFSAKITSLSAYSVGSTETFGIYQWIEGFNTADLMFGTANASSVTVSFWVKSSLTGTFGGSIQNSNFNRGYPFSYTINSADTWEYKTVSLAGDTSGTWVGATNGAGLAIYFSVGSGSSRANTAGSWTGTSFSFGATGQVNLVATNAATLNITGVQLEAGSVATPFERRPYGTELALCQRYYEVLPAWADTRNIVNTSNSYPFNTQLQFKVTKRANPTMNAVGASSAFSSLSFSAISVQGCIFGATTGSTGAATTSYIYVTSGFNASAEL